MGHLNSYVAILPIGHTVEGRELEIIRVGNPEAPHAILALTYLLPPTPLG